MSPLSDGDRCWQCHGRFRIEEFWRDHPPEDPVAMAHPVIANLQRPTMYGAEEAAGMHRALLKRSAGMVGRELRVRPLVFATASSPAEIGKVMARAHFGRPLVHVQLENAEDCAAFAAAAGRLASGCHLEDPEPRDVRGELLVLDPDYVLADEIRRGGDSVGWLAHQLWLTDQGPGPAFEVKSEPIRGVQLGKGPSFFSAMALPSIAKVASLCQDTPPRTRRRTGRKSAVDWRISWSGQENSPTAGATAGRSRKLD
jgi:hypothetical protein